MAFQENAPPGPNTPLLEENIEVEESGTSLLQVGNEGQRCQVVDGMIVPQPTDKGGSREERFSSFVLEQAGRTRRSAQPFHLGEECSFFWGRDREEGLAFCCPAELKQPSMAQKESFSDHTQSTETLPLVLSPRLHPSSAASN